MRKCRRTPDRLHTRNSKTIHLNRQTISSSSNTLSLCRQSQQPTRQVHIPTHYQALTAVLRLGPRNSHFLIPATIQTTPRERKKLPHQRKTIPISPIWPTRAHGNAIGRQHRRSTAKIWSINQFSVCRGTLHYLRHRVSFLQLTPLADSVFRYSKEYSLGIRSS